MRVMLKNPKSRLLILGESESILGEFTVPVNSMSTEIQRPQFFNVINEEGQLEGQVLARFYIKEYDQKRRKQDYEIILQKMIPVTDPLLTVNLKIALFGVRNLVS